MTTAADPQPSRSVAEQLRCLGITLVRTVVAGELDVEVGARNLPRRMAAVQERGGVLKPRDLTRPGREVRCGAHPRDPIGVLLLAGRLILVAGEHEEEARPGRRFYLNVPRDARDLKGADVE